MKKKNKQKQKRARGTEVKVKGGELNDFLCLYVRFSLVSM